ncbi:MAG: hypothetical protein Ct9H300mP12_10360 [Acidimicrobiales bacterium]|nr:MAG: hypothetical protein Ct9H300mP12_10360 [Acidimicrobiales bacterium]
MVNCNPETVSTDYDTSDRLYFEPLTVEDVDNIVAVDAGGDHRVPRRPDAVELASALPPHWGLEPALRRSIWPRIVSMERSVARLGATAPGGTAVDAAGPGHAAEVGYPVGSSVYVWADGPWRSSRRRRARSGNGRSSRSGAWDRGRPFGRTARARDRFLEDATEVDVDAVRDHTGEVVIGAVMEHVEEAGVHSGDSAW